MFEHGFPSHWTFLDKIIWLRAVVASASGIWKTVTGALIHITDALASPMQKCEVAFEPIQAGSGDPSPDNVRPITGWTGCNINVSGADTSNPTVYPISWQTEAGTVYGGTLTVNEDGSVDLVQDIGFVVYDGSQDESWNYETTKSGYKNAYIALSNAKLNQFVSSKIKCNVSPIASSASIGAELDTVFISTKKYFNFTWLDTLGISNVADFKTWLTTHNVQVSYELGSAVTYHLDNISQITTLAGENNIWADVNGTITLTYKSDGRDSDAVGTGKADYMKLLS